MSKFVATSLCTKSGNTKVKSPQSFENLPNTKDPNNRNEEVNFFIVGRSDRTPGLDDEQSDFDLTLIIF